VGGGAGVGHVAPASGERQVQRMSEVPVIGTSQGLLYETSQFSFVSSAAATQTWPKLSQYLSHRPP